MSVTRAKIVATLGPACDPPGTLRRLIEAGASIFRLNFSHADLDAHAARLDAVRTAADSLGVSVAILGDLPGPKIRVGALPAPVVLESGDDVWIGPDAARSGRVLPCTYPSLASDVSPGQRVLLADGAIRLLALGREGGCLHCRVTVGGAVSSGKGINVPDADLSANALSDRDWACVDWALAHDLDFLAMSFVRHAEEVRALRDHLARVCPIRGGDDAIGGESRIPVIAKIEKPQAVERLDSIVREADGIMVARGDLGVEMDLARVPIAQKRILACASRWGKPCIVATQMLESMTSSVSPTRAEATDVANAVLDGADAVMLSGETAAGRHPPLVVETMRRIVEAAEEFARERPETDSPPEALREAGDSIAALAHASWHLARDARARAVLCWSETGGIARLLSQNNFRIPVLACSSSARMTRRMALFAGVTAVRLDPPPPGAGAFQAWIRRVEPLLVARGLARPGDRVVVVFGSPLGTPRSASTACLHAVGSGGD